jgi:pimeloyl-ACP methyl ester carboxylesterase
MVVVMRILSILFAVFCLLGGAQARADILLLVHGYLAGADSWQHTGINDALDTHGWKRVGLLLDGPGGVQLLATSNLNAERKVYVADLPAEAPAIVQSDIFLAMLERTRQQHPGENIIIVGHSAGGVVARLSLIRGGAANVTELITIASPHVGTTRAEQALDVTNDHGPFNMVKSFFGGGGYDALKRSRGLLYDLTRPHPGNMLYWLNSQPHPDIKYVSIIRTDPVGFAGDDLVPGYSQDMNNVPALHGKSSVITTPSGHSLVTQDAITLLNILTTTTAKAE